MKVSLTFKFCPEVLQLHLLILFILMLCSSGLKVSLNGLEELVQTSDWTQVDLNLDQSLSQVGGYFCLLTRSVVEYRFKFKIVVALLIYKRTLNSHRAI
jgi:hypothetical protein